MGLFGFGTNVKKKEENIVKTCVGQANHFMSQVRANSTSDFGLSVDYVACVLLGMARYMAPVLTNNKVGNGIVDTFLTTYLSSSSTEEQDNYAKEIDKHYKVFCATAAEKADYLKTGVLSRKMADVCAEQIAHSLGLGYEEGLASNMIFYSLVAAVMKQIRPDLVG